MLREEHSHSVARQAQDGYLRDCLNAIIQTIKHQCIQIADIAWN
jgi:hypothetical protein